MIKKVYLASPFSSRYKRVRELRYLLVTRIASRLKYRYKNKLAMFLPITQSYQLREHNSKLGSSFEYWKDEDLAWIKVCDEVWVVTMPGWEKSTGVMAEMKYAFKLKKPVKLIDMYTLNSTPLEKVKNDKKTITVA